MTAMDIETTWKGGMSDADIAKWQEAFRNQLQKLKKLTPDDMVVGGRYNWKNQPERLVYLGYNWSGNGYWHQFEKVDEPGTVWCEVLSSDLQYFEVTDKPEVVVLDSMTLVTTPDIESIELPSYHEPKRVADWKQHNRRGRHKANARKSKKRK